MFLNPLPAAERIPQLSFLHKKNIGMLTNDAAQVSSGERSRAFLLKNGFKIKILFSPEHGIAAKEADGATVLDKIDVLTGLPIISLYGNRLKPSSGDLKGLDIVLFDVPDVGCRFYTYLWSMTYVMEACHQAGIPLVILDRPNPIGGNIRLAEGPMLDETRCSSFIGRWQMPVTHYATLGELALYFRDTRMPGLSMQVIPCAGWQRGASFFEKGIPFVPTSPAITDSATALLYPGMGLLEGIEVNEGRGTPYPFKQFGAPWIEAPLLQELMLEYCKESGISCLPVSYIPDWGAYAGQPCHGLRFSIKNPLLFKPVAFGLKLLSTLLSAYPLFVIPRLYPTVANPAGGQHLDRLLGIYDAYEKIKGGEQFFTEAGEEWVETITPYLMY
jgi:uncharacterized protein YbbC (DUF1343 family)